MRAYATSICSSTSVCFWYLCIGPSATSVTSVCGSQVLVYADVSYWCMRSSAALVRGLEVLVYAALSCYCVRPPTSICELKLLVYAVRPEDMSACGRMLLVYPAVCCGLRLPADLSREWPPTLSRRSLV